MFSRSEIFAENDCGVRIMNTPDLARYIDHTCLRPDATPSDIARLCAEAAEFHFLTVCVNPRYVPLAKEHLCGTEVKPIAVVGFPLGVNLTRVKSFEAEKAIAEGAREIDMVLWIGGLKEKKYETVERDIREVVLACAGAPVKVILETGLLTHDEKFIACRISEQAGAQFVKTCTGFAKGEATVSDVVLMRSAVSASMGVKASGGIRTRAAAQALISAGANRLGTSSSVALIKDTASDGGY